MQNNLPICKKENALKKVAASRSNLLLMIVLTAVNVALFAIGSQTMLLFSATVPYFAAVIGIGTEIGALAAAGVIFAILLIGIYLLCWIFSKKHYGFMIAALVLFSIDTVIMALIYIGTGDFSGIIDVLVHAWVMYYLIIGVKYGYQLKHLTPEEEKEYEELISAQNLTAQPMAEAPQPALDKEETEK